MKKTANIVLLLTLVMCLVQCKKKDDNQIRLSSWQSNPTEKHLLDSTLQQFSKVYPDTKVKFEVIPGNYSEKIQLMLGTHSAPQLFYIKDWLAPSYFQYDVLQPLNEFIDKDPSFDKNDFYPAFLNAFTKNGKIYGIPKDFGPFVLFYNEEMFKEAGLTHPPTNWKELEEYAKILTKDKDGDGKIDQYGFVVEPAIDKLMVYVYQNGGEFEDAHHNLQISNPAFVNAVKYYHGLYKKNYATIPSDVSMNSMEEVFGRKRCAMAISGGWFVPQLKDQFKDVKYKVAFLPKGKEMATIAFTVSYSMPRETTHKEEAWKLANYLTGKEGMKVWTSTGFAMPTRKSVAKELGYDTHPLYKYFLNSAQFARVFQVNYNERWYDIMQAGLQAIFYQNADIDQTLQKVEEDIKPLKLKN